MHIMKLMSDRVRVTRLLIGSRVTARLIIGSGLCQTRLCNRVGQVDTNPTREPKLPTLVLYVRRCLRTTLKPG
jgi:hypothetical protein